MKKKPLTHRKCVNDNDTIFKMILSILTMATIIIIIPMIATSNVSNFIKLGIGVLWGGTMFVIGMILLINAIKTRTNLKRKNYYIYMDCVSYKKVHRDEDSVSYLLCFANNKYTKSVSRKKYETIPTGTQYYLVQIQGSEKAIAAFPESEYYLDESVKHLMRYI